MAANGFDGVPWMMGGGAKHSANLGRVLAYAATSGGEGVISPGDLKVSQSSSADNKIHVATGAVAIRNLYGSARSETYIARSPDVSDLTVGSTGSSARSDLVVVRVRDPQYGAQAPVSLADGPYVFPEIIPGVPAGTDSARDLGLSEPMYAIARLDIPANTTAITDGMIKPLRKLVLPRSERQLWSNVALPEVLSNASQYVTWPSVVTDSEVPEWATHADMRVIVSGVAQVGANADAWIRARVGNSLVSGSSYLDNDGVSDGLRHTFMLTCGGLLLPAERGTKVTLKVEAMRFTDPGHQGVYVADLSTHVGYDIQYSEKIV